MPGQEAAESEEEVDWNEKALLAEDADERALAEYEARAAEYEAQVDMEEEDEEEEEEDAEVDEDEEGEGETDEEYESAEEEEEVQVVERRVKVVDWRAELLLLERADDDEQHARHLTMAKSWHASAEPRADREARVPRPPSKRSEWAAQFVDLEAEEEEEEGWPEGDADSSGFSESGGHVIAG
jgi:hypothetical protein